MEDRLVRKEWGCPGCGERDMDNLIADDDIVTCAICGTVYDVLTQKALSPAADHVIAVVLDEAEKHAEWLDEKQLEAELRSPAP